jgi:hypothetical protein
MCVRLVPAGLARACSSGAKRLATIYYISNQQAVSSTVSTDGKFAK